MKNLSEYRIENNEITKIYISGEEEVIPYTIENEKACLLELKETIIMLKGYIESCNDSAKKNGMLVAGFLAVGLYFSYGFVTEEDMFKFLFFLVSLAFVKYKFDAMTEDLDVVNEFSDKDMSIIYKTILKKKLSHIEEYSTVYVSNAEYEAENKNMMHFNYIRTELELEKEKLENSKSRYAYKKEYKINV